MPALRMSVTVKNAELVRRSLQDLSAEVPKVSRQSIYLVILNALNLLRRAPAPFQGPYPWVSEKQRRFVMARIAKGQLKVPYQRTGRYQSGWSIEVLENGYRLVGRAVRPGGEGRHRASSYQYFVGGNAYGVGQAQVHQGRWVKVRDAVDRYLARLPKDVLDKVEQVSRRKEGGG